MLLQNRQMSFKIPHTSTCILRTWPNRDGIHDGDRIMVESPIFNSISYNEGPISNHQAFYVTARVMNAEKIFYFDSTKLTRATLVCDDNDIFNMYVRFT